MLFVDVISFFVRWQYNGYITYCSSDSVLGIATTYALDSSGFESQQGQEIFFLFQNRPDRVWDPPSLAFNRYRVSFPELQRWGCKVDHLPPPSAEVKNEWSYTSIPPICLQGQEREKFYIFHLWNTKLFVSKVIVVWCGVGLTPNYVSIQSVCICKLTDILEYQSSKSPSFKIFRIDVIVSL